MTREAAARSWNNRVKLISIDCVEKPFFLRSGCEDVRIERAGAGEVVKERAF